jgi:hypothetical protein
MFSCSTLPWSTPKKGFDGPATLEAAELAARCIGAGLQAIVFWPLAA